MVVSDNNNSTLCHRNCVYIVPFLTQVELVFEYRKFFLPYVYLAPPLVAISLEFDQELWHQKTRLPRLSCIIGCVMISLAVLIELRFVTDRLADGRPDRQTYTDTRL